MGTEAREKEMPKTISWPSRGELISEVELLRFQRAELLKALAAAKTQICALTSYMDVPDIVNEALSDTRYTSLKEPL